MTYTALYRKWRPSVFSDVKGQDAAVTTLKNQVMTGRIGHAYLFSGTRGTGKTTMAKIFARAVNCEHPKDGEPCGECASCRAIAAGASMNVSEIDAASNNGVDSIREIREEVQYPPADGKYRVYIIDEAHMLTGGAANALLKTLEEPPSYVIFILATTDPNKLPVTVRSRCQRFDFHRMTVDVLMERVREVADGEHISIEDRAVRYIARKADGAMRDALSLLDQCVAFHYGEPLTYDMVLSVLGTVDNEVFSHFTEALMAGNAADCLRQIDDLVMDGRELSQFVQDLIWYLRGLMLLSASNATADILDVTDEERARMAEEANAAGTDTWMHLIRIFSALYNQMRGAVNKRVLLEIAVIRSCEPQMEENLDSVLDRLDRVEKKVTELAKRPAAAPAPASASPSAGESPVKEGTAGDAAPKIVRLPKAEYDDLMQARDLWPEVISQIRQDDYLAAKTLKGTVLEPHQAGILNVVFYDSNNYNICTSMGILEKNVVPVLENRLEKTLSLKAVLLAEPAPPTEYQAVTDEDLAAIHGEIEIEEDE